MPEWDAGVLIMVMISGDRVMVVKTQDCWRTRTAGRPHGAEAAGRRSGTPGHQDVRELIALVSPITSTSSWDSLAKTRQAATSASLS